MNIGEVFISLHRYLWKWHASAGAATVIDLLSAARPQSSKQLWGVSHCSSLSSGSRAPLAALPYVQQCEIAAFEILSRSRGKRAESGFHLCTCQIHWMLWTRAIYVPPTARLSGEPTQWLLAHQWITFGWWKARFHNWEGEIWCCKSKWQTLWNIELVSENNDEWTWNNDLVKIITLRN